jgi:hypothetical protein
MFAPLIAYPFRLHRAELEDCTDDFMLCNGGGVMSFRCNGLVA